MASRYVTITPNPCFDLTMEIGPFVFDDPNRVQSELMQSSGKGVNLSLVFAAHGLPTTTFVLAGRDNYAQYQAGLPQELGLRPVLVDGAIRQNMTICSADDRIIKINRAGAAYTEQAHTELLEELRLVLREGDFCIISGSLPPKMTQEQLIAVAAAAKKYGARLVMDSDGLTRDVIAALKPYAVKPNHVELAKLFDRETLDAFECEEAARELIADGVANVVVSMGADGLLAVTQEQSVRVSAPKVQVVSTVAAGDSSLAGFLMHRDEGLAEAARWGAAYGSAAVTLPGSTVGDRKTAAALYAQTAVIG